MLAKIRREGVERGEDSNKFRAILMQMGPSNSVTFFDPKLVRDLLTIHADSTDKSQIMRDCFEDLLGESFLFSKGDDKWKAKRKACSPGFYKDKLQILMEGMKVTTEKTIKEWSEQITNSSDKQISVNFTEAMPLIYTQIILISLFGEDVSDQKVKFINLETGEEEMIDLHLALRLILPQIVGMFYNPLRLLGPLFIRMRISTYDKRV